MTATKLTKTGQPVLGTTIEVSLTDGTWEAAKVVGKLVGSGRWANRLVGVILEWNDGTRQQMNAVDGLDFPGNIGDTWREVQPSADADNEPRGSATSPPSAAEVSND